MKNHGELFCLHCDYSTKDCDEFQVHLRRCSVQQKTGSLTCVYCGQAFFNRRLLIDHVQRSHNLELFCCDLCYYNTIDSDEFEWHAQQHFKVDCNTTCNKCHVSFDTEKQCEQHILKFHDIEASGCNVVGFEASHLVQQFSGEEEHSNRYKCLLCGYQTKHPAVINNHLDIHTKNTYRCQVSQCPFATTSKRAVKTHMQAEHSDLKFEGKNLEEKGKKITGNFQSVNKAEDGIYDDDTGGLLGHGSGSWRCAFCPDKPLFKYRRSYEKHISKHFTNITTNVATAIGNVFHDLGDEKDTSSKEEVCPICGGEFNKRSQFREHLQMTHDTDIVDVSDCDEEECPDPWDEEGRRHTEMWINQHDFNIHNDEEMDKESVPQEWATTESDH